MQKLLPLLLLSSYVMASSQYEYSCTEITPEVQQRMQYSWPKDLPKTPPVPLKDLRYITVSHWNFSDEIQTGEMVMHHLVADDIIEIFGELFASKFPINCMKLVDEYKGDDGLSILDNNSYAFCARYVATMHKWSNHAYGTAIDINPVQNPYIEASGKRYHVEPLYVDGVISPYLDRDINLPGMITKGNLIYNAFISRGWEWGGECFDYCVDLHHFQKVIPGVNKTIN